MAPRKDKLSFGIVLSDLHAPYHSQPALDLVCKVIKATQPDYLISVGDMLDVMTLMSHPKSANQRRVTLKQEMHKANKAFDQIDAAAKGARKVLVKGNHCDRFDRYINKNCPELDGIIDIPGLVHAKRRGWEVIPYGGYLRLGKLVVTHDVGISGERSIFQAEKDFNTNVITGHSHLQRWAVVGNGRGDAHCTTSGGWLGDPRHANYVAQIKRQRNWSHGFNTFYMLPDGTVFIQPVPIVGLRCVVGGVAYSR